ncbi:MULTISPECIES: glycosyltransferase [unclassified Tenacibaculum]|uniref:glycosyltransferase n=1 Tax=unclassified Tenacibaculum TaxID=2635139 RepID=UPI001F46686F|nr:MULTISPECIES: glycosyltransferase [unclassified Tenacibaculum]MCF2873518.1 glycosyltransferase family 4 protein [Tenacibaculum sp. Cn5-1]MCF2933674.1 glycosyltransferase family 4 protein [Tenacibaculum sp. Cn5-34]MCG7509744.1 glycosyltransferase family 4 protein [Tenacibaculum sp. Cn5-46]
MKTLLIIGYVWVEKTTGAGNRMLQLIEVFKNQDYKILFGSPAQKTENSIELTNIGLEEVSIELNSSSFDEFIEGLQPDIVMFDRFMMEEQFGWRVAENSPKSLRLLDTEDLHFLRKTRHKQLKKGEEFSNNALLNSDDAKREIASILRCDLTLIISSYEMKLLKEIFKIDERLLYHLPFLLDRIDDNKIKDWKSFEERNHFVFIGNYFHAPNVDTVLELKNHVWKQIRKELPKAEMHIYGAYATQQIEQLNKPQEGFLVKGFAEDAIEVISNSKVVLAPIRFGAGIKGKLTEAMITGTPSVTTLIGAEGMHENLSWNGFVESNLDEFSNKAVLLYSNQKVWKESQEKGIDIINQIYDKEKIGFLFLNRIEELQKNLDTHRTHNFLGSLLQHQTLKATKYMSKWIEEKNKN